MTEFLLVLTMIKMMRMMLTLSPMKESLSTWVNFDARNGR